MRRFFSIAILLLAATAFNGEWRANAKPAVENKLIAALPAVIVDKGSVELTAPESEAVKFEIFSITGQLIKSITIKGTTAKIDLPKGFYIIKCDSWTKRVMIK